MLRHPLCFLISPAKVLSDLSVWIYKRRPVHTVLPKKGSEQWFIIPAFGLIIGRQ
jgi:hypothetical protein